jgi:hypothetical protein
MTNKGKRKKDSKILPDDVEEATVISVTVLLKTP